MNTIRKIYENALYTCTSNKNTNCNRKHSVPISVLMRNGNSIINYNYAIVCKNKTRKCMINFNRDGKSINIIFSKWQKYQAITQENKCHRSTYVWWIAITGVLINIEIVGRFGIRIYDNFNFPILTSHFSAIKEGRKIPKEQSNS